MPVEVGRRRSARRATAGSGSRTPRTDASSTESRCPVLAGSSSGQSSLAQPGPGRGGPTGGEDLDQGARLPGAPRGRGLERPSPGPGSRRARRSRRMRRRRDRDGLTVHVCAPSALQVGGPRPAPATGRCVGVLEAGRGGARSGTRGSVPPGARSPARRPAAARASSGMLGAGGSRARVRRPAGRAPGSRAAATDSRPARAAARPGRRRRARPGRARSGRTGPGRAGQPPAPRRRLCARARVLGQSERGAGQPGQGRHQDLRLAGLAGRLDGLLVAGAGSLVGALRRGRSRARPSSPRAVRPAPRRRQSATARARCQRASSYSPR